MNNKVTQEYNDEHTNDMFQGSVSVVIDTGIADDIDARSGFNNEEDGGGDENGEEDGEEGAEGVTEEEEAALNEYRRKKKERRKNEPSLFDKAMKQATIKAGNFINHHPSRHEVVMRVCIKSHTPLLHPAIICPTPHTSYPLIRIFLIFIHT